MQRPLTGREQEREALSACLASSITLVLLRFVRRPHHSSGFAEVEIPRSPAILYTAVVPGLM